MINRVLAISVILIMGFTGCKSSKNAENKTRMVGNKKTHIIVNQILENEKLAPKTLSFKAPTEMISGDKTTSFKASVRMVTDSVIWISITAYSYEVARVLATPDTVKYFSRTDKKYFVGDYSFIEEKMGVKFNYFDLQALILARSFGLDKMEKIKRSNSNSNYILSSIKKGKLKKLERRGVFDGEFEIVYTNWVNPENLQVERVDMWDMNSQNKASIQYSAFENIEQYVVLSAFKMNIIAQKSAEISSTFSKITVNEPLKFPFKISSKYEQIK